MDSRRIESVYKIIAEIGKYQDSVSVVVLASECLRKLLMNRAELDAVLAELIATGKITKNKYGSYKTNALPSNNFSDSLDYLYASTYGY